MATDATGSPTPLGIPKYNTSVDAPSGLGFNAAMDAIDALITAKQLPTATGSNKVPVWNGSSWVAQTVPPAGLTPGTVGQVLATISGGSASWIGGAHRLFDQTLGASAAAMSSAIPAGYAHLLLVFQGMNDTAGRLDVVAQFNNDGTAANYFNQYLHATNVSVSTSNSNAQAGARVAGIGGTAQGPGIALAIIPNYGGTTFKKQVIGLDGSLDTSVTTMHLEGNFTHWNNTAAISQVALVVPGGNFITGSRLTIYGLG